MKLRTCLYYLATIVIGLLCCRDLLYGAIQEPALTNAGHSWDYNIWRTVALARSLRSLSLGGWVADFGFGYGYPLFTFTAPGAYLFPALLYNLGVDVNRALACTWILIFVSVAPLCFFSTRKIFGNKSALLVSILYLLAPYHFTDVFVRTNLSETQVFLYLPLLFYGLTTDEIKRSYAIIWAGLAIAAVALTHLPSIILVLVPFTIFSLASGGRVFYRFAVAIVGGLIFASPFLLPALLYLDEVRGAAGLLEDYYSYQHHFVYWFQLISSYWERGASSDGPFDTMSFSLSAWIVVAGLLSLLQAAKADAKAAQKLSESQVVIFAGVLTTVSTTFLMTAESGLIWQHIAPLAMVQFPWRFLMPTSFFLGLSCANFPDFFVKRFGRFGDLSMLCLCGFLFYSQWDYGVVVKYDRIDRGELTREQIIKRGIYTTNSHEFLPKAVKRVPSGGEVRQGVAEFYYRGRGRMEGRVVW
ncbi:hypothetical protein JNK13_10715, partial [bacterium]|nr:hypothetical protein [bacterium]